MSPCWSTATNPGIKPTAESCGCEETSFLLFLGDGIGQIHEKSSSRHRWPVFKKREKMLADQALKNIITKHILLTLLVAYFLFHGCNTHDTSITCIFC